MVTIKKKLDLDVKKLPKNEDKKEQISIDPDVPIKARLRPRRPKPLKFSEKVEKVQKHRVKKTRYPKLPEKRTKRQVYKMTAPVRGHCLIFANSTFENPAILPPLQGYTRDAVNLQKVFEGLHFKVSVFKNKTVDFIKEKLKKISNTPVRTEDGTKRYIPDAFIAVILSHGKERLVLGKEFKSYIETGGEVLEVDEIIQILNNENCQLLRNRPKLLFIQACQGDKEDHGVYGKPGYVDCSTTSQDTHEAGSDSSQDSGFPFANAATSRTTVSVENFERSHSPLGSIPTVTDIMIAFSTVSGYRSYVKNAGSVFGVTLADILIDHANNTDLQTLINLVCADMKPDSTAVSVGVGVVGVKQIAEVVYKGWTKQLFFNPGYKRTKDLEYVDHLNGENNESTTNGHGDTVAMDQDQDQVNNDQPSSSKKQKRKNTVNNVKSPPPRRSLRKAAEDPKQPKIYEYCQRTTPQKEK